MHRRSRLIAAAGAAATALTMAGCSSTVEATTADRAADPLCVKAAQRWPATVSNGDRREVSADSPTVRAWGDPAIIARCGLSAPAPSTNCVDASGVDWTWRDLSDGKAFITYGREPAIEVLVPKDYAPEPLVLSAFAEAAKQIPQGPNRCS